MSTRITVSFNCSEFLNDFPDLWDCPTTVYYMEKILQDMLVNEQIEDTEICWETFEGIVHSQLTTSLVNGSKEDFEVMSATLLDRFHEVACDITNENECQIKVLSIGLNNKAEINAELLVL